MTQSKQFFLSGATLLDTETGQLHLPLQVLKSSMTPEDHRSDQVMGSLLPFQRQVQTCGIKRLINVQCTEWLYLVNSRGALPSTAFRKVLTHVG